MASYLEETIETLKSKITHRLQHVEFARRYLSAYAAQAALVNPREGGLVIFDVGANEGQTAQRYLSLFPKARIFSFEPYAPIARKLRSRFEENAGVEVVEQALSDEVGMLTFHVNGESQTNSLLPRPPSGRRYYSKTAQPKGYTEVSATTLDAFTAERGIGHIDILKMDAEGAEFKVLRGGEQILRAERADLLYLEVGFVNRWVGDPLFWEVCALLDGYGYSLYGLFHVRRDENGQTRTADAIFVSPTLRQKVDAWA